MRGATELVEEERALVVISTHAPRAGSDIIAFDGGAVWIKFQPTLPVRGATEGSRFGVWVARFQPTLPVRGATTAVIQDFDNFLFQPTLPVRGATV